MSEDTTRCYYCDEVISINARKCKHCGEFLDGPSSREKRLLEESKSKNKDKTTAGVLSFVIPGAGQMYKGKVGQGIIWLILVIVGYFFFVVPGLILHFVCIYLAATK